MDVSIAFDGQLIFSSPPDAVYFFRVNFLDPHLRDQPAPDLLNGFERLAKPFLHRYMVADLDRHGGEEVALSRHPRVLRAFLTTDLVRNGLSVDGA